MRKILFMMAAAAVAGNALAADKVTFTRHAYDEGSYIYSTYKVSEGLPWATEIRPQYNDGKYTFILFSEDMEPKYSFTLKALENGSSETLNFANNGSYNKAYYIGEILVTQHLFNDDDLYEVIFRDNDTYYIYNEKGEYLGDCPSHSLYEIGDKLYFYKEYEDGSYGQTISALYSINTSGAALMPVSDDAPRLEISPNPADGDDSIVIALPGEVTSGMSVKVFSIGGALLVSKECGPGEHEVTVPAHLLSKGVCPVIAVDSEGNITGTGKIVKE